MGFYTVSNQVTESRATRMGTLFNGGSITVVAEMHLGVQVVLCVLCPTEVVCVCASLVYLLGFPPFS